MGVGSLAWIFDLISGFKGGRETCHWHGVVVELTVNWQPRCRTGNGHVHVSNFLMQVVHPAETSGLFYIYHIHSLDDNN